MSTKKLQPVMVQLGGTSVVIIEKSDTTEVTLTVMSASEMSETGYRPAESTVVYMTLDQAQRLVRALQGFLPDVKSSVVKLQQAEKT